MEVVQRRSWLQLLGLASRGPLKSITTGLRISQHAIASILFFGHVCRDRRVRPLRGRPYSCVELQTALDGSELWVSHLRRSARSETVCTENLQLAGAKASDPELRGNEAKLSRHFKGRIWIENLGVRSLDGQPASAAFVDSSLRPAKRPQTAGFRELVTSLHLPISRFWAAK